MPEDGDDTLAERFRQAHAAGGWQAVVDLAHALRDAREATIVRRVNGYLSQLITDTGEENPTLTVRDVRAHLFEVPQ